MGLFTNFLGTKYGRLFGYVPDHVDTKLPPGCSPIPVATFAGWLKAIPTMLWDSPNGFWAAIALFTYFMFPYDLSPKSAAALGPFSWAFFKLRFPIWFVMTFGYNTFWHVTLYLLQWGKRPFVANRRYNVNKTAHNVFWGLSGVAIWVCFENVFAYLWASGRLPYISDPETFGSPLGVLSFVLVLVLTPVWGDVHFYFTHRLLHFKPLFQQVHSLHHRNTDIEPFAGLCMHPVEHLYFYAAILPELLFTISPFGLLWTGVYHMLAPGASHSGWEDHFQSDPFHYMHHRYFEVNYAGTPAGFMDHLFSTFCDKFREGDKEGAKAR